MGLFGKKKVIDLTERYRTRTRTSSASSSSSGNENSSDAMNFLGDMAASGSESRSFDDETDEGDGKKKKLARRILDMTDRIEDLSNQIYRLQQRVELLEKKMAVKEFE